MELTDVWVGWGGGAAWGPHEKLALEVKKAHLGYSAKSASGQRCKKNNLQLSYFPGCCGPAPGQGPLLSLDQGFLTVIWAGSYSQQGPLVTQSPYMGTGLEAQMRLWDRRAAMSTAGARGGVGGGRYW